MNDSTGGARLRTLWIAKTDTLGDLVLFAPALQALVDGLPGVRVIMLVRESFLPLGPLLSPAVEWVATSINPFVHGPTQDRADVARLEGLLHAARPEVFVSATSRRNWLDTLLACRSGADRRVAAGDDGATDAFFGVQLARELGADAAMGFNERIPVSDDMTDWRRGFALADAVLGRALPRQLPVLHVPDAVRAAAAAVLDRAGLHGRAFAACAAAGFANVRLKTWPAERYVSVIRHLHEQHGLPVLLLGNSEERDYLMAIAARTPSTEVWCGGPEDLPLLVELVGRAALFVGNDTGAMHLAAAAGVPTVAIFGGGTWPRFVPTAERSVAVVHPLPCFGCGWDCAFGDAPCVKEITVADVLEAVNFAIANRGGEFREIRSVQHLSPHTQAIMAKAAVQYRDIRADHQARQHKFEELTELDREKDAAIAEKEAEIDQKEAALSVAEASMKEQDASILEKESEINALKAVCDERYRLIVEIDQEVRALRGEIATVRADKALIEQTLAELPDDRGHAVKTIAGQAAHIRNLEALVQIRAREIDELKATAENLAAGRHDLEQAKYYGKLLAEKEAVIQQLNKSCQEREAVIRQLTAETTGIGGPLYKLWFATKSFVRAKVSQPAGAWMYRRYVENYWMQIGVLRQYPARPLRWDEHLGRQTPAPSPLRIAVVTPSYGQDAFLERTMLSILDQRYPNLKYAVQDGGSKDRSVEIIQRHAPRLAHWASEKDKGQADAIRRGFERLMPELGPDDVMAWLNSDDLLAPGALAFVADYFARHPDIDAIYGHRIIIDQDDAEIGRWIMPPHDPHTLEWIDYVPQETLFWRKRAWDRIGGIDPTYQFALDWDFLARLQQAGCRIVRVPYFLGAFRVHSEQKTTQAIHSVGADEMRRIRIRFHGEQHDNPQTIDQFVRKTRRQGVVTARLHALGLRR